MNTKTKIFILFSLLNVTPGKVLILFLFRLYRVCFEFVRILCRIKEARL